MGVHATFVPLAQVIFWCPCDSNLTKAHWKKTSRKTFIDDLHNFCLFREDRGDQILDYKLEIQTMEEQFKKLQKEVRNNLNSNVK